MGGSLDWSRCSWRTECRARQQILHYQHCLDGVGVSTILLLPYFLATCDDHQIMGRILVTSALAVLSETRCVSDRFLTLLFEARCVSDQVNLLGSFKSEVR